MPAAFGQITPCVGSNWHKVIMLQPAFSAWQSVAVVCLATGQYTTAELKPMLLPGRAEQGRAGQGSEGLKHILNLQRQRGAMRGGEGEGGISGKDWASCMFQFEVKLNWVQVSK